MKDICLHETSKGGELALFFLPDINKIKKVNAIEPHTYCFQALDGLMIGKTVSAWS